MPPRRRSLAFRLLLVVASGLLGALLAELGTRVWLRVRGEPYAASRTAEALRALESSMRAPLPDPHGRANEASSTHVLNPYYGVELEQDFAELERQAQLFRSGAYDDAFVVVFLGGSVCANTVNAQLERMSAAIRADARFAGRRVQLFNQGRGAFKQPQQTTLCAYLLALGWRPDALVEIDGFNELALGNHNAKSGVHPLQPWFPEWLVLAGGGADRGRELELASDCVLLQREASEHARRVLDDGRLKSAILGRLALARLNDIQSRWSAAQERFAEYLRDDPGSRAARGPKLDLPLEQELDACVASWFEGSRSLAAMCAARGIAYVHVLQPTLHDAGSKPLTEEERASSDAPKPWITAVTRGYASLRERGKELASLGVPFADLSGVFREFTETTYYDSCHFRGLGEERFADAIVRELLARLPAEIPARRAWAAGR